LGGSGSRFSVDYGRFWKGFWEKRVVERGFSMVKSWWNAWWSWCS